MSALPEMVDKLPEDEDARRSWVSSSIALGVLPTLRLLASELTDGAAGRVGASLRSRGHRSTLTRDILSGFLSDLPTD